MVVPRLLAAAVLLLASTAVADDDEITVFAAASLTDAVSEAAQLYEEETGVAVRLSFASSSTLARQIESGAPAQIYAAADLKWMDYLAERDLIETATRVHPIGNRLVLVVPSDSPVESVDLGDGVDLAALLGEDGRLAVGDPDHVPAGIYAKEALVSMGAWGALEPRLARAENVRSALALVELGETPLGIVYETDAAVATDIRIVGVFPPESHSPVTYPFAVVKGQRTPGVASLFAFLTGERALAIYDSYGFTPQEP